jgi:hypothetical protein
MSNGGPGSLPGAAVAADAASPNDPLQPVQPCPLAQTDWIEVILVGEDGQGVAGEEYALELPDGTTRTGTLDARGRARIDCIAPGMCRVTFPRLDREAWGPA